MLAQALAEVGEAVLAGPALLLQVGAGGEGATGAGDHHRADPVLGGGRRDRVAEVEPELLVPGVQRLGAVELDRGGGAVHPQVDRLVRGHQRTT